MIGSSATLPLSNSFRHSSSTEAGSRRYCSYMTCTKAGLGCQDELAHGCNLIKWAKRGSPTRKRSRRIGSRLVEGRTRSPLPFTSRERPATVSLQPCIVAFGPYPSTRNWVPPPESSKSTRYVVVLVRLGEPAGWVGCHDQPVASVREPRDVDELVGSEPGKCRPADGQPYRRREAPSAAAARLPVDGDWERLATRADI